MADISQVKLPNGDTYNLVDETSGYIKNYTETDPVFTASAAAGITATDISNWNGKSSTDEKLAVAQIDNTNQSYNIIISDGTTTAKTQYISNNLQFAKLVGSTRISVGTQGTIKGEVLLQSSTSGGYIVLTNSATGGRTITFPDKTGTVALTSDIPQVYSSTNTGGYLTMATLPIYDGTVE